MAGDDKVRWVKRPHVVILGAGASLAALPEGDLHGKRLPLMSDLVETLGLSNLMAGGGISFEGRGFEDVYDEISSNTRLDSLRLSIDTRVREYFSVLKLPTQPTIYDYLVLSLRPKDVVATFNWDPFLWQACLRNRRFGARPVVLYLHGCVALGYCVKDKRQGPRGMKCSVCGNQYADTRLLYPVKNKDYVSDPYIASQWKALRAALQSAFVFTIFGYSAPTTDAAAVDLMSSAWGTAESREFEEIEMIDLKSEEQLADTWERFIHSHHFRATASFDESIISVFPRRTCEAMFRELLDAEILDYDEPVRFETLEEAWSWFGELRQDEQAESGSRHYP